MLRNNFVGLTILFYTDVPVDRNAARGCTAAISVVDQCGAPSIARQRAYDRGREQNREATLLEQTFLSL
jgi:hypothetical protein